MSGNFLAVLGGCLAAVLLLVLVARTILAELHAGTGGAAVRRPRAVRVLDVVGVVLLVAMLAALFGRMAVALH